MRETVSASEAILEMSAKKLGMTTVVDRVGALAGIITDGDLRRFFQQGGDFSKTTAGSLASRHPKLIGPDELAAKAVEMMERLFHYHARCYRQCQANCRGRAFA